VGREEEKDKAAAHHQQYDPVVPRLRIENQGAMIVLSYHAGSYTVG